MVTQVKLNSNKIPKRVFILGAGFSKAILNSMPTAAELGKELFEGLQIGIGQGKFGTTEYENWLSRIATDQPDLTKPENLRNRAMFETVAEEIANIIFKYSAGIVNPPLWLYEFLRICHLNQSTIITFNYDCLIENALNCDQSFGATKSTKFKKLFAADCLGWNPHTYGIESNPSSQSLTLLKLHGSVDWKYIPEDPSGTLLRMPSENERTLLGEKGDEILEEIKNGFPEYSTFIVPPTVLKHTYLNTSVTKSIWLRAKQAIKEAGEIFVLGYSLPQSDIIVGHMLRETMTSEHKLIVADLNKIAVCRQAKALELTLAPRTRHLSGRDSIEQCVSKLASEQAKVKLKELRETLKRYRENEGFPKSQVTHTLPLSFQTSKGQYNHLTFLEVQDQILRLKARKMSLAEYNALSEEEKQNGEFLTSTFLKQIDDEKIKEIELNVGSNKYAVFDFSIEYSVGNSEKILGIVLIPSSTLLFDND